MRWIITTIIFMCFTYSAISKELAVVTEVWPPYSYTDEQGNALGLATRNVQAALKSANIAYQIDYRPWARAFHIAKTKPNILIYPMYRTIEREALFHWFCPILSGITVYAISKRSRDLQAYSLRELIKKGVTAGVMRDGNNHELLVSMGFDKDKLDPSSTELANIRKLIHDRVDIVFQSKEGFEYGLNQLNVMKHEFTYGAALRKADEGQVCAAVRLGSDEELVLKLQKAFSSTPL